MNSSGIKRGLATTAVSALAIAGIPFIASSASAAPGDSIAVDSVGPVRNAGALGGVVVLKTKGIDETKLRVAATDLVSKANTPNQSIDIVSATRIANGDNGDSNKTDGLDEITLRVTVAGPAAGSNFAFAVYEDEDGTRPVPAAGPPVVTQADADAWDNGEQTPDVDSTEARANVTGTTAGAPASIAISPDSQTTSAGVPTGDYTATVRDASNNLTQLTTGEAFALAGTGVTFTPDATLSATDLVTGQSKFQASSVTPGSTNFTATGNGAGATPATINDTASINVIANATIVPAEFDIDTAADTWGANSIFGDADTTVIGNQAVQVRVDQGSVTFNFASQDSNDPDSVPDDANKAVVLTLSGTGVTFGGEATRSYTVVLDGNGEGSLTVSPEAISAGDSFTFASAGSTIASTTVQFARAAADTVKAGQSVYVSKVGDPTSVTVTVLDQFGDPIGAPAQVSIVRGVRNGGTETARQTVGADGTATFALPDAGTGAGTEAININLYDDQFDPSGVSPAGNEAVINYTADGLGGDFSLNDVSTGSIVPLTDAVADNAATEYKAVTITGGTPNAPATVTVDNGALVLKGGTDDTLAEGSATDTVTLDGFGTGTFWVVGTKTGTVNISVASAGRTKAEVLTVTQATGNALLATARNIELEGPENVIAGDVATYTATVTDAFGNPVAGVDDSNVAFQVSGPGNLQNKEGATDANGEIEQTVLLTDNADGSITVRVNGVNDPAGAPVITQFGKAANSVAAANDAPGLSASVDTASVTSAITNLDALEQAVEDAEEALAEAQANLAAATADLDVAQAQLAVAQANVDTLQAKKQNLRQKLNKAKANDNKQKAKTTRKKLRAVKRDLRDAKDALAVATTRVDAQQTVVDIRQGQVDDKQAELDAAQAELDEAQN